jgi:hypothetical protein
LIFYYVLKYDTSQHNRVYKKHPTPTNQPKKKNNNNKKKKRLTVTLKLTILSHQIALSIMISKIKILHRIYKYDKQYVINYKLRMVKVLI